MKEHPILFSGPMVRALLDDSKTQTRRVVKPQPYIDEQGNFCWNGSNFGQDGKGPHTQAIASPIPSSKTKRVHCPYGKPGDRLWVRETWQGPLLQEFEMDADPDWHRASNIHQYQSPKHCEYAADGGPKPEYTDTDDVMRQGWRPSIHMPRWASRITLEVTGVRVERLQDISKADALAEGIAQHPDGPWHAYRSLWTLINGLGSWDANPWVWVVEFKRVKGGAA